MSAAISDLSATLATARQRASAAMDECALIVEQLRAVCTHERVAECDYKPETNYSYAHPPRRICEICGIEEKGWGCGYQVLTNPRVRRVSREDLYHLRNITPLTHEPHQRT